MLRSPFELKLSPGFLDAVSNINGLLNANASPSMVSGSNSNALSQQQLQMPSSGHISALSADTSLSTTVQINSTLAAFMRIYGTHYIARMSTGGQCEQVDGSPQPAAFHHSARGCCRLQTVTSC